MDRLRQRVRQLENKVTELNEYIASGIPETNTVVDDRSIGDPERPLPPNSEIFFYLGEPKRKYDNTISVKLEQR